MNATLPYSTTTGTRTDITCTKCGKAASVPFVPTPGRPVFCRDCFSRPVAPGPGAGASGHSSYGRPAAKPNALPRKRMMAQGRKTHFIFDAKAALVELPGGMDDKDARAFLEGLFARGARTSTEAAQEFLDEKLVATLITGDQRSALGRLVDRYSFYR